MPNVTVTRRLYFNAAHRVHNPDFSAAENAELYGKCNNVHGHGHNYSLEVSVRGPVDPGTGYVIDLVTLKKIAEQYVVDQTDHRHFNHDVPYMAGINPTSENIVVAMWNLLEPHVRPGRLVRLRLIETENNFVEYEGD